MPGRADATRRKADLRRLVRDRRAAAHLERTSAAAIAITQQVLTLPETASAGMVAAYVAYGSEPPTELLLQELLARGTRVLLPVLLPDLDLDWAAYETTRMVAGLRQALEPAGPRLTPAAIIDVDLVVVPALAVARDGARLGQGGGSYDRALARNQGGLVVALLWSGVELLDAGEVPTDEWDRPVHVVVTPDEVIRLRPARPVPG
ncbi:MAG: 5-formyltetrahydrofolate cyclo-ligase [Candidatus Nanopelagicales bacterium]